MLEHFPFTWQQLLATLYRVYSEIAKANPQNICYSSQVKAL